MYNAFAIITINGNDIENNILRHIKTEHEILSKRLKVYLIRY